MRDAIMSTFFGRRGLCWATGLAVVWVLTASAPVVGPLGAQDVDDSRAEALKEQLDQAKKLGAKGQLPNTWWDLEGRVKTATKQGATDAAWDALEVEVARLISSAGFVHEMRKQKSGMEAMLGRYDHSLEEIAVLQGVDLDPRLSGEDLADFLVDHLNDSNLQRQILVDSLMVENRRLMESVGGRVASQESLITALQVEVSSLRKRLWETDLRAGVAEADRSAAETVLTKKQEREAAITAARQTIGPDNGEILILADGEILMRIFGLSFGVGSATLNAGQNDLVERIATSISLFPGAGLRIEGHTDDTGGRDANLRLSRRRAETVARLLEQKLELEPDSLETEGRGPDRPIAPNSTAEGRALNRRIDVLITPAG